MLTNWFRRSKSKNIDTTLYEKREEILLNWINGQSELEIITKYGDFGEAVIKAEKSRLSFPAFIYENSK